MVSLKSLFWDPYFSFYTSMTLLKLPLNWNSSSLLMIQIFFIQKKDLKILESKVNNELINLHEWLSANKLTLNIKKSNFVIFRPYQKKLTFSVRIKIFDNVIGENLYLENKEYVKYLGILIDGHLSWKHQIDYISTKIKQISWTFC